MRVFPAPAWVAVVVALTGCAPRALLPSPLSERRDPAPLLASLETYNRGPDAVRIGGSVRAVGKGRAEFGATAVEGLGVRFDAVAGPFSTPIVALACLTGDRCRAYLPSRRKIYADQAGEWEGVLGQIVRGRVPLLGPVIGAWQTVEGDPALLLRADGEWQERVDFDREGRLPVRLFLGRAGEKPLATIGYHDFSSEPLGPFPRRIEVRLGNPERAYEIVVRRIEPAPSPDARVFTLSVPPDTEEEKARGPDDWNKNDTPPWLTLLRSTLTSSP